VRGAGFQDDAPTREQYCPKVVEVVPNERAVFGDSRQPAANVTNALPSRVLHSPPFVRITSQVPVLSRMVPMIQYRLYLLDAAGRSFDRKLIEADDRASALAHAGAILAESDVAAGIEVWEGPYMVQRLTKLET